MFPFFSLWSNLVHAPHQPFVLQDHAAAAFRISGPVAVLLETSCARLFISFSALLDWETSRAKLSFAGNSSSRRPETRKSILLGCSWASFLATSIMALMHGLLSAAPPYHSTLQLNATLERRRRCLIPSRGSPLFADGGGPP